MRLLVLPVLCGTVWTPCIRADYCEWHLDYFVYHRVNYTEDPWSFSISPTCTALQCSTYLWGSIDDKGAVALAEALRGAPQLEELTVGYNNIGDAGAKALADVLPNVSRLRLLHLGWNGIGDVGAQALASGLRRQPLLEELNLFWNNVGEAGAGALAWALRHTPKLRKLNLAWNSMGNAGAIALAEALRATPELTELSVAWSGIGNPGAIALAAALRHLPRLQELRVRWNAFGETGALALAEAVAALEVARGEANPGERVVTSGIPWPMLEAARNASSAAADWPAEQPPLAPGAGSPPSPGGGAEAGASTWRRVGAGTVTCATHRCTALVVGNANYTRGALPSAVWQDAREVASQLERLGFKVSRLLDGTKRQMKNAAKAFSKGVETGSVSLLYFIGYGFQLEGANHLLPVDYTIEQGVKASEKAVAMSGLLQSLAKRKAAVSIFILDACRPSPFRAKAAAEGLAPVVAPLGSFVALAAAPGTVRWLSGAVPEAESLYTRHLLEQLAEPGLQVEEVFKRLRKQVANETSSRQVPWESSSLVADFVPNARRADKGGRRADREL